MFLWDLFAAAGIAVVLASVLLGLYRPYRWNAALNAAGFLFLATWAGTVWIAPAGPVRFGMFWLILLLCGLAVCLVFAVRRRVVNRREEAAGRDGPSPGTGSVMVRLMIMFVLAFIILAGYAV
jgi:hypothetical protein